MADLRNEPTQRNSRCPDDDSAPERKRSRHAGERVQYWYAALAATLDHMAETMSATSEGRRK